MSTFHYKFVSWAFVADNYFSWSGVKFQPKCLFCLLAKTIDRFQWVLKTELQNPSYYTCDVFKPYSYNLSYLSFNRQSFYRHESSRLLKIRPSWKLHVWARWRFPEIENRGNEKGIFHFIWRKIIRGKLKQIRIR